jgi:hypothetical protein
VYSSPSNIIYVDHTKEDDVREHVACIEVFRITCKMLAKNLNERDQLGGLG